MVEIGAPCHFATHCLVINGDDLLFDPGYSSRPPPGYRRAVYPPMTSRPRSTRPET